jgi:excisionase family DNA binding protein
MDPIGLFTIDEVAELLKISASSARRLQQSRLLPFIKVGGSVRFAKKDIVELLKRGRVEAMNR